MNITSGKNIRTVRTDNAAAGGAAVITKIRETPRCLSPAGIAVYSIPIDKIRMPAHLRQACAPESIAALAQSIHKYGVIHPLTVRTSADGMYELVCGTRRLRAVKLLGLRSVNCIVIASDRSRCDAMSLSENVQREDLHYLDIAEAIGKLCTKYGYTAQGVSVKLCLSERYVTDKLRLLEYTEEQRKSIREARLCEEQLLSLLNVTDSVIRSRMLERVISRGLDARLTDELVFTYMKKRIKKDKVPNERYLIRDVRIFYNTVDRAIEVMRHAGCLITADKQEQEDATVVTIRIPRQ